MTTRTVPYCCGGLMALVSGLIPVGTSWAQSGGNELPKPQFNSKAIDPPGRLSSVDLHRYALTPNDLNPPQAPFPDFYNVYIHPAECGLAGWS